MACCVILQYILKTMIWSYSTKKVNLSHKVILKGIFKYHYYYNKKSLTALHLSVIAMFTIQITQSGLLFYLYKETTFFDYIHSF